MSPATSTPPLLALSEGVATITLNRPAHRNRLQDEDLHTLLAHFERIEADASLRVVVLRANTEGQPRPVFCAGYDITQVSGSQTEGQGFGDMVDAIEQCLFGCRFTHCPQR